MSEETTGQRVIRVIAKYKKVPAENLSPATKFEELAVDSFDALNMIFELEDEFDINIPNETAATMKSVGEAINGVDQLLAAKAAAEPAPPVTP